jgi:AcrR family transcriptional regulator
MSASAIPEDKYKILRYSQEKFLRDGILKKTIDEIARELQMSKNTIYKYFPNKEALMNESVECFINSVRSNASVIIDSKANAIEKLVRMFNLISAHIMKLNERFLKDVQLEYPQVWLTIDRMRKKLAYDAISRIIRQGKREKLFTEFPVDIMVAIFIGAFRAVINPEFLLNNSYSTAEAFSHTYKILLNAILSEKGKTIIKKLHLSQ